MPTNGWGWSSTKVEIETTPVPETKVFGESLDTVQAALRVASWLHHYKKMYELALLDPTHVEDMKAAWAHLEEAYSEWLLSR